MRLEFPADVLVAPLSGQWPAFVMPVFILSGFGSIRNTLSPSARRERKRWACIYMISGRKQLEQERREELEGCEGGSEGRAGGQRER